MVRYINLSRCDAVALPAATADDKIFSGAWRAAAWFASSGVVLPFVYQAEKHSEAFENFKYQYGAQS